MWLTQMGHKLRQNMAHTTCMLDKQGYIHASECTYLRAQARIHTQAHTHTEIYNTYGFSLATIIHKSSSTLRYSALSVLFVNFREF